MHVARSLAFLVACAVLTAAFPQPARSKRQLADDDSLQPLEIGTASLRQTGSAGRKEGISSKEATALRRRHRGPTSMGEERNEGSSIRLPRQTPTTADGIPIFDRNKVSLDFPGNLFGPSVSLLIRSTKIVGSVIQNSAVRYQTFLRLFSPLFRGQFAIKGLEPATTTTTTTTTTTPPPPASADNEVRR